MKILHNSITILTTIILFLLITQIISPNVFVKGQTYDTTLETQFGNSSKTEIIHNDAMLILNQTTQKLAYKMGENVVINTELINIGSKTVDIAYCEPWVALEIKDQTGREVWPNSQLACIPEFSDKKAIQPGEHFSVQPWSSRSGNIISTPSLDNPGNYAVISVAVFTFDTSSKGLSSVEPLWSKPLQITVLPEKYVQNETNSPVSKISSNKTVISVAEPIANQECVDKIMAQEHAQDVPIDNVRALDLATNYTQYKLKTLGHNYTLSRIYHNFSIDSCTAQLKDVVVEFTEKNSTGRSLITITEDLGLDRVKAMDISQVDELVTPMDSYMTPVEPQIGIYLIPFVILVIGSISVAVFFIFRVRKKK